MAVGSSANQEHRRVIGQWPEVGWHYAFERIACGAHCVHRRQNRMPTVMNALLSVGDFLRRGAIQFVDSVAKRGD
jgi:hypothetical protein